MVTTVKVIREYESLFGGMSETPTVSTHHSESTGKDENKGVAFAQTSVPDGSKRKRYLTAKYDRKTRHKISETIRLENFVFDQLRKLYQTDVDDYDCDIDLEEIGRIPGTDDRRNILLEKLKSCPASNEDITVSAFSMLKHTRTIVLGVIIYI
ncbi:uncharacterized protein DEA37_0001068 [Paragonimus westermani]|uniref:Uncharacterized protein n=1 Tax=Paragonimus westermani TaxID=34504 RepID=A0A5J4NRM1_9TREM|nr:uncharacterized protein DEA37_0001068 [Paragonimus westermani]